MRTAIRALVHGFVLAVINIVAILAGFGVYTLLRPVNQLAIQIPAAVLGSVLAFGGWTWLLHRVRGQILHMRRLHEYGFVYSAALLWSPLVFVPLHFITQGYLTSFGNILGMWFFQLPVNALVLAIAARISRTLSSVSG